MSEDNKKNGSELNSQEAEKSKENSKENKKEEKKKSKGKKNKKNKDKILIENLEKELDVANNKAEELQDKFLRLVAEYDNYRRRTAKEKLELRESVQADMIKDLLSFMDDFDRALKYCNDDDDKESHNPVKEGLMIMYKKFSDYLKSKNVEEIDALHKDFDTDFHEAVTKAPAPSKDLIGKVINVIEKGYKTDDKVIRYSKVVVGE